MVRAGDRPENGVGERVEHGVPVGVSEERPHLGKTEATERQDPLIAVAMGVEAVADPGRRRRARHGRGQPTKPLEQREVVRSRDLQVPRAAGDHMDRVAGASHRRSLVGPLEAGGLGAPERFPQERPPEALGSLGGDHGGPVEASVGGFLPAPGARACPPDARPGPPPREPRPRRRPAPRGREARRAARRRAPAPGRSRPSSPPGNSSSRAASPRHEDSCRVRPPGTNRTRRR